MNQQYPHGIRIKSILPSTRLGLLALDESIPFETQIQCPGCLTELTVVSELVSEMTKRTMRVGACATCGYIGYMDRPARSWTVDFYAGDWDKEFTKTPEQMQQDVVMQQGGVKGSRYGAFILHKKLDLDKNRSVLDVGCGYGLVLKNFQKEGFTKVYGVENSRHRAQQVRDVFNIQVVDGDFGNPSVEEELKKYAPFGLVISHHVLEHVYDPNEVFASLARLQKEGDYAIFALPDSHGEHINYATLYLPHLHGFTRESLEMLFNRHGYEVVIDDSPNMLNQCLAARKVSGTPKRMIQSRTNYIEEIRNRFVKGLALNKQTADTEYELMWEQNLVERDTSHVVPRSRGVVSTIAWSLRSLMALIKSRVFKRLTAYYVMRVEPLHDSKKDRITISFAKDINLFIK